ncbi:MAG: ATP-grasp domain-containing protein [Planctomycetes bacterium]|nr:ATP-grasp domain-containing protein [Planctomycetota bacterium]
MIASPHKERPGARGAMATLSHDSPAISTCVVVGASARSFAESAARAGWSVHAADLFGDRDLGAAATAAVRVGDGGYPRDLPAVVAGFPAGPCAYTGAVENHPEVIAALAEARPLAGCGAAAVRAVRDPIRLAEVVREAGLWFPETHGSPSGLPGDGTFLVKPLASAGGRGIRPWLGDAVQAARPGLCWQRRVRGAEWSVAFVADGRAATLVAAGRPATCRPACGARRFAYSGSLGVPLTQLTDALRAPLDLAGRRITAAFGLVGCFGIDAIVDRRGRIHVLEVNPRPTSSLELVERASGWSAAAGHLAACGWGRAAEPPPAASDVVWGKAIVRMPRGASAPHGDGILAAAEPWTAADGLPAVADIPAAGVVPAVGGPLVTVFACGRTLPQVESLLRQRAVSIRRLVRGLVSRPSAGRRRRPSSRGRTASGTRPRSSPGRSP